ncbi:MAG: F0F1 ATP synthase subunit epsilon [Candidatus Sumerlaeia bacterium]|nr:F0F1 ATP synthase subunit epsilon [Candidatus Sumerlaeia bacterium]
MANFHLQIVTQQHTVFDRDVTSLTMPGEEGSFGVWANHRPIIAVLKEGPIDIRIGSNTDRYQITGGFFEMEGNKATLLVDSIDGMTLESEDD